MANLVEPGDAVAGEVDRVPVIFQVIAQIGREAQRRTQPTLGRRHVNSNRKKFLSIRLQLEGKTRSIRAGRVLQIVAFGILRRQASGCRTCL